ncbi:MAG: winged helix-turn-helix transcriptional regulator, partial [Thermoplasmata archaeon]|nr:Lrp/AsnC family transcriptional regulator [Thermoplasmata archaeon]NIS11142.1 Lrp/AsnC family transcriptional regulator [Thermoplasmata archaeon]NIS19081.1 Lrp/AsnC family transcriptional regulator [Thermoplasmata archaeon]NIT76140.1 Lrp/AsnC family transcriptional regulator [Thermoplasmata archaeon]NIU48228.1 Lrp/AsnC family transcriptional regulator [Thermoplasmata archaeon]
QTEGRIPVSEISRRVDLSENGVRYRLEKLEEAGYIKNYTVLLNPRKFGKSVTAIFNINTAPENPRDIIAQLEAMEELQVIYQTTGTYSIMAIGLFVDIEELNTFIEGKLSNSEILEYTVDVVRRKLKETTFQI